MASNMIVVLVFVSLAIFSTIGDQKKDKISELLNQIITSINEKIEKAQEDSGKILAKVSKEAVKQQSAKLKELATLTGSPEAAANLVLSKINIPGQNETADGIATRSSSRLSFMTSLIRQLTQQGSRGKRVKRS